MKLYFSPGACSMAPHIALREAGLPAELVKVDLKTKRLDNGTDYLTINPKGYVPLLELDDGERLSEVAVILQYIADRKPDAGLAPKAGTMERYRMMEWLNFISSEIHKSLGALFNPKMTPEWRDNQVGLFGRRCDVIAERLDGKPFLMGQAFTLPDAYLFTVLGWTGLVKVDMGKWPALREYSKRVAARPAVKEAMREEGLIK